MVSLVFDSSALLRYLDRESGWERVDELLDTASGTASRMISAVQWGEIAGSMHRKNRSIDVKATLDRLMQIGHLQIMPVSASQAVRAALLRIETRLPYADSILADLALQQQDATLITADYDFKAIEHLIPIEFLPPKLPTAQQP